MDLSIFHHAAPDGSPRDFKTKDKFNGWTSRRACRFLEWTGWYSFTVDQRLLGHYRLFHHFKTDHAKRYNDLSAIQAYILHCRTMQGLKYFMARIVAFMYSTSTRNGYHPLAAVAAVNRTLINGSSGILQEFLSTAEEDFGQALIHAIQRIKEPSFLDQTLYRPVNLSVSQYNSPLIKNDYNSYSSPDNRQYYNTTNRHTHHHKIMNAYNNQNIPNTGNAKGKEKGVFSKHQILILFDLLSRSSKMEKIDFEKTTWFEKIAALLHALTGKSAASWMDELKDHHTRDLYEYRTKGEFGQLLGAITNLAEIFETANFHWIAEMAYKKINDLQKEAKFS